MTDSTQIVALLAGLLGLVALTIGAILMARERPTRAPGALSLAVRFVAIGAVGCIVNVFLHSEIAGIVLGLAFAAFMIRWGQGGRLS